MADDERPTNGDGFDDWLDEEPGPDSDPYAALADDDSAAEIADWMAFTEGTSPDEPADRDVTSPEAEERVAGHDDVTEEIAVASVPVEEPPPETTGAPTSHRSEWDEAAEAETAEVPIVAGPDDSVEAPLQPATSVELDEFDGGGRADTDEIPIVAAAEVVPTAESGEDAHAEGTDLETEPTHDEVGDEEDTGELPTIDEDTGEIPIVSDVDTGELDEGEPEVDTDDTTMGLDAAAISAHGTGESPPSEVFDVEAPQTEERDAPFDMSHGDYLSTATREHEGLAAAIAEAETEETEQVALAAPIPGLEATVVGFEDVVEAEGHTRARARGSGDLVARVITAVVLIAALGASLVWRPALVALATVVFVIGAGEFYTALRRSGRQPIAVFGFVGILGASIGGFVWGAIAIPVSFVLITSLLLLFYAVVPGKPDPMANMALTITVMVWAGLGTYAMMIVSSEDYRPLVIGVVVVVAVMDIAQYFVGRTLGRHQLAPWVSPKKTVEGLVGGVIVAFALGALLHFVPPFELTSGLAIGAAAALFSPLGDLAMSAAKRALGIKDMGSILPGHGGFMDRIDGLLFVIPVAWAIFLWTDLL